ncbi:MAG: hypothetical protein GXP36_05885 [Actinobacteria bacterium]|nr:hypothetical protein [Actinomycetota bacterium]
MEFGEWFLTYPVDDCPVKFLSTVGGFWVVPDPRVTIEGVPAENIDGEIWTIEVGMSWAITEEGGTAVPIVNVIAAAPGDKPYYIGNPSKVAVDAEFTDQKATYVTTFVNAVFDGPDELAATVTMTCDE